MNWVINPVSHMEPLTFYWWRTDLTARVFILCHCTTTRISRLLNMMKTPAAVARAGTCRSDREQPDKHLGRLSNPVVEDSRCGFALTTAAKLSPAVRTQYWGFNGRQIINRKQKVLKTQTAEIVCRKKDTGPWNHLISENMGNQLWEIIVW